VREVDALGGSDGLGDRCDGDSISPAESFEGGLAVAVTAGTGPTGRNMPSICSGRLSRPLI